VGVLIANIEGRVLVSYQRGLLDEVGHGILVTQGADIQACLLLHQLSDTLALLFFAEVSRDRLLLC
jgi:hypothetical protein